MQLAEAAQVTGIGRRPLAHLVSRGFVPAAGRKATFDQKALRLAAWCAELAARDVALGCAGTVLDEVAAGLTPSGFMLCTGTDREGSRCRWVHLREDEVEASRHARGARPRVVSLAQVAAEVEQRLVSPGGRVPSRRSRAKVRRRG